MPSSSSRSANGRLRLFPLLSILIVLCLMVASTSAQINTKNVPDLSTAETLGDTTTSTPSKTTEQTTEGTTKETSAQKTQDESTSTTPTAKTTKTTSTSDDTTTSEPPTTVLGVTSTPSVTGSAFVITGAPSIAGVGVPTMQVPNTANAPFMQKSNLPEGTVFICVGAALAFLGAAVLAWRGIIAWSLHRSVKRAAQAYDSADAKPILRSHDHRHSSHVPNYGSNRHSRLRGGNGSTTRLSSTAARTGSVLSIDQLAGSGGIGKPGSRGNLTAASAGGSAAGRHSLFFSPTASGGGHGHAPTASTGGASYMSPGNRSSGYLPAGFYAAGSSQPAGGAGSTHLGGGGGSGYTALSNLGPGNNGSQLRVGGGGGNAGSRSVSGTSPPGSPALPPSRGAESMLYGGNGGAGANSSLLGNIGGTREGTPALYSDQVSSSTLNLAAGQQGRAPSAYLEDLFENHGNGPRERF